MEKKFEMPDSGFDKVIKDISEQRKATATEKEKKEIFTVEASGDGGKTWNIMEEYDNVNEAVNRKRELDHGLSSDMDYRVGNKE